MVREEIPVLLHEAVEVGLGVIAARVRLEHRVQRGDHVLHPLHRLGARAVLQRLLHAAELAVEHLAAEQVLELLEGFPRAGDRHW